MLACIGAGAYLTARALSAAAAESRTALTPRPALRPPTAAASSEPPRPYLGARASRRNKMVD
ncbi:MAG: hypothetical protein R3F14_20170 [Polyangiaceae bacterium]